MVLCDIPDDWFNRVLAAHAAAKVGPPEIVLDDAPSMHCWLILRSNRDHLTLCGMASGHPRLPDAVLSTSQLVAIEPSVGWARSVSRWYRLGDSLTKLEAMSVKSRTIVAQISEMHLKMHFDPRLSRIEDLDAIREAMARYIANARKRVIDQMNENLPSKSGAKGP